MVASPEGLPTLDILAERSRLERALRDVSDAGRVELEWLSGQTWEALRDALWHDKWHVLHFVGHGSYDSDADEGLLALADDSGHKHLLTATQIGHLLADNDNLRLVVLNACEGARGSEHDLFSSTAGRLVASGGVAAVVAMQYEISDQAAIQFAKEFYTHIARGAPVDAAVTEARLGMSVETRGSAEWGTPVLYMQSRDGRIFDIAAGAEFRSVPPEHRAESEAAPVRPAPAEVQPEAPVVQAPVLQTPARERPNGVQAEDSTTAGRTRAGGPSGLPRWVKTTLIVFVLAMIGIVWVAPKLGPAAPAPPRAAATVPPPRSGGTPVPVVQSPISVTPTLTLTATPTPTPTATPTRTPTVPPTKPGIFVSPSAVAAR
jgi:hypothetical protein